MSKGAWRIFLVIKEPYPRRAVNKYDHLDPSRVEAVVITFGNLSRPDPYIQTLVLEQKFIKALELLSEL